MAKTLDDKVMLVTGGASGMGRATALRCAAEGARVVVGDLDLAGAEETVQVIEAEGGVASAVGFDAMSEASCCELVEAALSFHGQLDSVVNVAGIGGFYRLPELSAEIFERFMTVNLTSVMVICRESMPHLVESRGSIINFSSINGRVPVAYHAAYDASKAGVLALTKSIAQEFLRDGVRCNAICPGGFDTNMNKTLRVPEDMDPTLLAKLSHRHVPMADPTMITGTVVFLASADAAFITGEQIVVDGGVTAFI